MLARVHTTIEIWDLGMLSFLQLVDAKQHNSSDFTLGFQILG